MKTISIQIILSCREKAVDISNDWCVLSGKIKDYIS